MALSFEAKYARLRDKDSWCAKRRSNEKLSVDLGQIVSISGVATQGSKRGKTTEYRIYYSYDGGIWYGYPGNINPQVRIGQKASRFLHFYAFVGLYHRFRIPFEEHFHENFR